MHAMMFMVFSGCFGEENSKTGTVQLSKNEEKSDKEKWNIGIEGNSEKRSGRWRMKQLNKGASKGNIKNIATKPAWRLPATWCWTNAPTPIHTIFNRASHTKAGYRQSMSSSYMDKLWTSNGSQFIRCSQLRSAHLIEGQGTVRNRVWQNLWPSSMENNRFEFIWEFFS